MPRGQADGESIHGLSEENEKYLAEGHKIQRRCERQSPRDGG